MKKIFTMAFIMLTALTTSNLYAQTGFKLGLGAEGALPLGNLKNAYNFGAGLTLRAAYGITETSAITLTSGAIAFLPKKMFEDIDEDTKAQLNIPVKAGYKYKITGNFYAIGEAGVTIVKSFYSDDEGELKSAGSSHFTYAPGIGVQLGGFDASIRYEGFNGGGYAGLRLGFNF